MPGLSPCDDEHTPVVDDNPRHSELPNPTVWVARKDSPMPLRYVHLLYVPRYLVG